MNITKATPQQAAINKRKQQQLRAAGFNVKIDGSWGPWQQKLYQQMTAQRPKPNKTITKKSPPSTLDNINNNIKEEGVAGGLLKSMGVKNDLARAGLSLAAYMAPGVGNYLSAGDAINDFRNGDYKGAAMNAIFALPVIGNAARGLGAGAKALKVLKTAGKYGNTALKFDLAHTAGQYGREAYNALFGDEDEENL